MSDYKSYFDLVNFRVLDGKRGGEQPISEATVQIKVKGRIVHTAADGAGPVNALDNALRKALCDAYPHLNEMKLMDFKVRVLSGYIRDTGGTASGAAGAARRAVADGARVIAGPLTAAETSAASNVRVLIESGDKTEKWTTVGLSHNIIAASWQALVDSFVYKLFKDDPQKWPQKTDL